MARCPRRPVQAERRSRPEPAWDAAYLSKVDYDLWLGPAAKTPFNVNRFHYNWHWHWAYGNGDTGNQGPHQFDIARWGLGKNEHPVKVASMGGYFGPESAQNTPNVQTSLFEYADGTVLEFATRGESDQRGGIGQDRQPVLRQRGLDVGRWRRPQVAVVQGPQQGREGPRLGSAAQVGRQ